jgi:hypothetical protein
MLLLQQLIKPIPFGSHDEPDSYLAEKLGLGRRSLLCHAHGLPEAKRDVYSLFDSAMRLSGLPNSDEITLLHKEGAHLSVVGDFAGLPKPFEARSCECKPHDVFKGVWSRTKRFFGCESGWAFIQNGAVNGWHANSACNGDGTTDVGG